MRPSERSPVTPWLMADPALVVVAGTGAGTAAAGDVTRTIVAAAAAGPTATVPAVAVAGTQAAVVVVIVQAPVVDVPIDGTDRRRRPRGRARTRPRRLPEQDGSGRTPVGHLALPHADQHRGQEEHGDAARHRRRLHGAPPAGSGM